MQKESAAEIELNLKKKARRRLVGAIALVLLMMVILPFVLKDREAETPEEQVKITMSNEVETLPPVERRVASDSGFDSSVVPTDTTEESQPVTLPKSSENSPSDVVKSATEEVPPVAAPAESDSVPENKLNTDVKTLTESQPKVDSTPVPAQDKDKSNQTQDKKGTFFVQIGIFSDPENVKRLQAKLSALGYQSKTEKINTPKGVKTRLKTQSFSSRKEAAIALENIKDAELPGMVVSQ